MNRRVPIIAIGWSFIVGVAGVSAAITYEYDGLGQLSRVTYDDGSVVVYEYDAVGNRTLRVTNSDPNTVYLSTHVAPPGNGSVTRNPDFTWYPVGTPVELTAAAEGACSFVEWTGNVPAGHEQDNPLTITLDVYKSVTAHFASPLGDADCDCDLDLDDFAGFQQCFGESPVSDACTAFDFDGDDDVDMDDFDAWAQTMTGPTE